jgi:hypothetical protein
MTESRYVSVREEPLSIHLQQRTSRSFTSLCRILLYFLRQQEPSYSKSSYLSPCSTTSPGVFTLNSHTSNTNNRAGIPNSNYQQRTSRDLGFPASTTFSANNRVSELKHHRKTGSYLQTSYPTCRCKSLGYRQHAGCGSGKWRERDGAQYSWTATDPRGDLRGFGGCWSS